MKETVLLFLAPGFEEVEAIAPIDILRRGDLDVKLVAVSDKLEVKGAHNVTIVADILIDDLSSEVAPLAMVFPGGMPGAANLYAHRKVVALVEKQHQAGKLLAAICASPGVLFAQAGVLSGRTATAYPSFESYFPSDATHSDEPVVKDGHIITAQGPAFSMLFGLEILKALKGEGACQEVAQGMLLA